jgi:cyclic beta-1,2-glucan synthetase
LRIVLVENLRRTAERMVRNRAARQEADELADRLLGVTGDAPESVQAVLAGRELAALPDAFSVQLIHRLRDQDPRITPALVWLDERLELQNTTTDAVVRDELQRQGASSITVRNIITSMRLISDVDWTGLFERISLVDDVLAAGATFKAMDFPTRNLYRSAVEDLARGAQRLELDVARAAIAAASDPAATPDGVTDDRRTDVGYHLLAGGRERFEATLGFTPSLQKRIERASRSLGVAGYGTAIVGVAAALVAAPIAALAGAGLDRSALLLFAFLGAIPALELAVALVNRGVMRSFGATLLPALELGDGIPLPLTTLVAVPMLLTSPDAIAAQIERLEIHYLTSPEGELYFALLSDWIDASPPMASRGSTASTGQRRAVIAFCYSTVEGCGTQARAAGSAGSASVASCMSSIGCSGVRPTPLLSGSTALHRSRLRRCATSSRSMPTHGCRARRYGG